MRRVILSMVLASGCAAPKPAATPTPTASPTASAVPEADASKPSPPHRCASDPRLADADVRIRNLKHDAATQLLDAILKDEPDCPGAHARLGRIALERGAFAEAEAKLTMALDAVPDREPDWHAWLGRTFLGLGRPGDAAEAYARAYALAPSDGELGLEYADALLLAQRYAEAVDVAGGLAARDKRSVVIGELGMCSAWCLIGEGQLGQDDHDAALEAFRRAVDLNVGHYRAWAGLALSAEAAGQREQAIDAWEMYLRLDCCSERSKTLAQPRLNALRHP